MSVRKEDAGELSRLRRRVGDLERAEAGYHRAVDELRTSLELLKKTQQRLIESEKMAVLGRLVGGVAHEVNTPVGVAVTAASLLEERSRECRTLLDDGQLKRSDLTAYLETAAESSRLILSNLRRAAEFIGNFKQVAVDQVSGDRRAFNLREYLLDTVDSLRPKLKKTRHGVEVRCPGDLTLDSYPGAFGQIVSNLIMNSLIHGFDAIPEGRIRIEAWPEGKMLRFRYRDDGRGIDPDKIERVFEPFFTTRRGKGGDGLGLHIVYNLVTQRLGGRIHCESAPGGGVTFTIRVPLETPRDMPETIGS